LGIIGGQYENRGVTNLLIAANPPGGSDSVNARHLQVEDDDCGANLLCKSDGFRSVAGFCDPKSIGVQAIL